MEELLQRSWVGKIQRQARYVRQILEKKHAEFIAIEIIRSQEATNLLMWDRMNIRYL